mgnify:CR=1 FL=1
MDTQTAILEVLVGLNKPIRLPTAQWLFSDLLRLLDCKVRLELVTLQIRQQIKIDNGGWITVNTELERKP